MKTVDRTHLDASMYLHLMQVSVTTNVMTTPAILVTG